VKANRLVLLAVGVTSLLALSGCARSGDVAARVGSTTVPTSDVAARLGKRPQSLSPARDSLLKKGLIYSGERGRIAFTVPHFGRYLRGSTS